MPMSDTEFRALMHSEPEAPPWSAEAEQSVIGSLLLDNSAEWALDDMEPRAFFDSRHQVIFATIKQLLRESKPADVVTVFDALGSKAHDCGGLSYLNQLAQCVPSSANARRYAAIVTERAAQREVIAAADLAASIARRDGDAESKLEQIAGMFARIRRPNEGREPVEMAHAFASLIDRLNELHDADGAAEAAIPTSLPTLDRALAGGLQPGCLYVLAARPSVGKSSLAGQLALTAAARGRRVLFLSQEMPVGEVAMRAMANLARVNMQALQRARLEQEDWSRLTGGVDALRGDGCLHVDDEAGLTIAAIVAKARRHQRTHGLDMLVLDYLQLCVGTNGRDNRNTQIEEISRGLKVLAKELRIVVIALSQLSRTSVQRTEPDLSDLRDSGAIEQDADAVLFLSPKRKLHDGALLIAGILAKNRNGPRGRIALAFHGAHQRWVESTEDVSNSGGDR